MLKSTRVCLTLGYELVNVCFWKFNDRFCFYRGERRDHIALVRRGRTWALNVYTYKANNLSVMASLVSAVKLVTIITNRSFDDFQRGRINFCSCDVRLLVL